MKALILKTLAVALSVLLPAMTTQAIAAASPHQRLEQATVQVIQLINDAREYADDDPDRFYREVDTVMSQYIDFASFARAVMGKYGSGRYYSSLSPAEQQVHRARVARFEVLLKERLIRTYAQGLLTFGGNDIEVVPPQQEVQGGSVNVLQLVHNEGPYPHRLIYRMKQGKDGEWWVRNVTIGSISMGLTFRDQFADALRTNGNDLDKAIDSFAG